MYYYDSGLGSFWFMLFFFSLVLDVIVAFLMQNVAKRKGYDESTPERTAHPILACVFLGIFGILYIMALPDLVVRDKLDKLIGDDGNGNVVSGGFSKPANVQKSVTDESLPEL